jgi:flagellar biosynthesis protein FlhG
VYKRQGYKYSLVDCLSRGIEIDKAVVKLDEKGFNHLDIIPSGNLDDRVFNYSKKTASYFLSRLGGLIRNYDLVIFDLGAGVNNFILSIFSSVDYPVLIVNPEPPSLVDAYSLMKLAHMVNGVNEFNFAANRALKKDYERVKLKLESMKRFLPEVEIDFLGYMPPIKNMNLVVNSMGFSEVIRKNSKIREKALEIFGRVIKPPREFNKKGNFLTRLLRIWG